MGIPQSSSSTWNSLNYAPTPVLSVQDYLNNPTIPENQIPISVSAIPNATQAMGHPPNPAQPRELNDFDVLPDMGAGYGNPAPDGLDVEAGKLGGALLDLIWPGWPPRLPTPGMSFHPIFGWLLIYSYRRSSVSLSGVSDR